MSNTKLPDVWVVLDAVGPCSMRVGYDAALRRATQRANAEKARPPYRTERYVPAAALTALQGERDALRAERNAALGRVNQLARACDESHQAYKSAVARAQKAEGRRDELALKVVELDRALQEAHAIGQTLDGHRYAAVQRAEKAERELAGARALELQRGNALGRIAVALLGNQNNVSDDAVVAAVERVAGELAAAREGWPAAFMDVVAERVRQVAAEGWTTAHDDQHNNRELADAASCYARSDSDKPDVKPPRWPWDWDWWKPKDYRRNLVKAGALILAEIERYDRTDAARAAQMDAGDADQMEKKG